MPTSAGAFAPGQEQAPAALRAAGLVAELRAAGVEVVDRGDREVWRWRPDRTEPRAQNISTVVENWGRNEGLPFDSFLAALRAALAAPKLAAVTVTELNPDHTEPGGGAIERLVGSIATGLAALVGRSDGPPNEPPRGS